MERIRILKREGLNILYTLDKGFEVQLRVSLNSLIKNTVNSLNVFIIFDGMDENSYKYLKSLENERVKIKFLSAPKIADRLVPDRGAKNQFYRLYLTEVFQNFPEINRVLYLDCDTLVRNCDIENLRNIDMGDAAIAATIDPWSSSYKSLFNLKKNTNMFNAGVFLIDISKWREKKYDEKLKKMIEFRKHFIQADQGLLNELIHGKFKILEPRFNAISSYFEMTYDELICYRKPVNFYVRNQIAKAVKCPTIIHFTSTFLENRPWQDESNHPFESEWIKEANLCHIKVRKKKSSVKKRILKKLFYFLPRKISIYFFGFLQAYVRPIKFRLFS